LPSKFLAEISQRSDLSARFRSGNLEGSRDFELLLSVEWWRAAIIDVQSSESSLTSSGLVGEHTSDHSLDHSGGASVMEGTVFGVGSGSLVHLFQHDQLVSVVVTSEVKTFTADQVDGVAVEEFFGDDGANSTDQVVFAVDGDVIFKGFGHFGKNDSK